jgi:hypothetical protein
VPVVELHTKACIGKQLEYCAFKLDQIFLRQRDLLEESRGRPPRRPPQIAARFRPRANSQQRPGPAGPARAHS